MTTNQLTITDDLVTMVQTLADTCMSPRTKFDGQIATARALPADIRTGATIDVSFDDRPAIISLLLDTDGAVTLNIRVLPQRAGYMTILLSEDATPEKVTKHTERAVVVMRNQIAEKARIDAIIESERNG